MIRFFTSFPCPTGVDVWPYLSGATSASPRGEIVLDHHMFDNNSGVEGCAGQVKSFDCTSTVQFIDL